MPAALERLDHVHVYVTDRPAAEQWYREVLGFARKPELEMWAVPHGPLVLQNDSGSIVLALFEQPRQPTRSTIALAVSGPAFFEWLDHLARALQQVIKPVNHGVAWSLYFSDPDENPFEIITYDYAFVSERL